MIDKKVFLGGFAIGAALGTAVLISPVILKGVIDFKRGFLGEPSVAPAPAGGAEIKAGDASPALAAPLSDQQQKELMNGLLFMLHDRYAEAAAILGKYAMLGDPGAQGAIGGMFYFGKGLPLDHAEGIRWLSLAAAQGDNRYRGALAAALNGSLQWESSTEDYGPEYVEPSSTKGPFEGGYGEASSFGRVAETARSYGSPYNSYGTAGSVMGGARNFGGARQSVEDAFGAGSASSSRYLNDRTFGDRTVRPAIGSPTVLNPAGPGQYSDSNGDIYTQAGPHGVVNTRTGEFSPTNN